MKLRVFGAAIAAAVGLGLSGQAFAGTVTVFSNPISDGWGSCAFSTACAATFGLGDDFAGQQFNLTSPQTVNAASFDIMPGSVTGANWAIYQSDGPDGLPGTLVASGVGEALTQTGQNTDGWDSTRVAFGLGSNVQLSSGAYYLAVQAVSPVVRTSLYVGQHGGAVESFDGGASWSFGYEGMNGVAVALYDVSGAVPEPATWAMLILGVGMIGCAARRRSAGLAAAA